MIGFNYLELPVCDAHGRNVILDVTSAELTYWLAVN